MQGNLICEQCHSNNTEVAMTLYRELMEKYQIPTPFQDLEQIIFSLKCKDCYYVRDNRIAIVSNP